MPETEVRIIPADTLEWRAAGDGEDGPTISGYGAVWNSPSYDLGGFKEIVAPGAFSRSLKSRDDVFAFFNHNPMQPLGSRKAGNLTVVEDERGLHYEIKLPNTTYANDVAEGIRAGVIRGSSFSFMVKEDSWRTEKGIQIRTLHDVDVSELGPVVMPAYGKTTAQVRSMLEARGITLPTEQRDDCDPEDLLEMLSGRAFDEMFLACLIEAVGDILEIAAMAATRAGDPSILELASQMTTEATAEVAMLRDFQTRFLAGEVMAPPPMEENSLPPPPYRLALARRRLQLAQLAK